MRGWSSRRGAWARSCRASCGGLAGGSAAASARSTAKGWWPRCTSSSPMASSPTPPLAADIVRRCVEKGLLMFAPVGYGGASVKIAPPLIITEEPLRESLAVLEEALGEAIQ